MKIDIRSLFVGLLCAFVACSAIAKPKIDRALEPYFRADSNTNVTVIVTFHDKALLPRLDHAVTSHAQVEMALRNNAKLSQMATMQQLLKRRDAVGGAIKAESLWLFNAAILHVPASELKNLAQNNDLIGIFANRKVHLVGNVPMPGNGVRGEPSTYTYGLEKINLPALNAKAPQINGNGVRVGILDSGIDATHKDLEGKVVAFHDFVGGKTTPYDDNSHGTHVAGTIAGGNASGTHIGVAPGAKLVIAKFLDSRGSGTFEGALKAMQWFADPDGDPKTNDYPRLVSNSWVGGSPNGSIDPMDDPLCKAIGAWVKLGIVPVFAAGNSGPRPGTVNIPGACPASLTAGATDDKDQLAGFSSRGPAKWKSGNVLKPTISAPGVKVISSVPGGKYDAYSGTSMATPHVSGLVALIFQTLPNASVEDVQKLIIAGATHLGPNGPNNDFGAGRIDAFATIKNAVALRQSR